MLTTILTVRYRVFSPPIAELDSFSHRGDVRVSTKYNVTDKRVHVLCIFRRDGKTAIIMTSLSGYQQEIVIIQYSGGNDDNNANAQLTQEASVFIRLYTPMKLRDAINLFFLSGALVSWCTLLS